MSTSIRSVLDQLYNVFSEYYLDTSMLSVPHAYMERVSRDSFEVGAMAFLSSLYDFQMRVGMIRSRFLYIVDYLADNGIGIFDLLDDRVFGELAEKLLGSLRFLHRFDSKGRLFKYLLRLYYEADWRTILQDCRGDLDLCVAETFWDMIKKRSIDPSLTRLLRIFLSSRPSSPHKRLNLFLRWMIRDEPPDLGLWSRWADKGRLLVPLGTEIARAVPRVFLGRTGELPRTRRSVRRVTGILRTVDPVDPVKYDYVLSRPVILGLCNKEISVSYCWVCPLRTICRTASKLDLDKQKTASIKVLEEHSWRGRAKSQHDKILGLALKYLNEKYIEPYNLVCISDRSVDHDLRPDLLCNHGSSIVLVGEAKTSTKQKASVIQLKTYLEKLKKRYGEDKEYYAFLIYGRYDPVELQHIEELVQLTSLQHTADHIEIIVLEKNRVKPIIIE